jgi:hypothetical protein
VRNLNPTLNVETLERYLGPPMVHPVEYWAKMWRLPEKNGKYFVVKCPKPDNCVLYYTDSESQEHRDALTNINQLPPEYRQEKMSAEAASNINSQTVLTFQNVTTIYGEPEIDPDIPFVYKWTRGNYVLTMIGKIFSYTKRGEDDRSTVGLFGHLPPDFRFALNTQGNREAQKQVPLQMPNPEEVLKPTEASEKAKDFESPALPDTAYAAESNEIATLEQKLSQKQNADVADSDFDLDATLKNMGIKTTKMYDDEFPDDDDRFKSSITKQNEFNSLNDVQSPKQQTQQESNRKEMEPERGMRLEDWEGVRDGKCPKEIVDMRVKIRARKAADTRRRNKALKEAKAKEAAEKGEVLIEEKKSKNKKKNKKSNGKDVAITSAAII